MPSWPQPQGKLDDLKREAIGIVDEMLVFTQQMVDQIFSFSELGFQEYDASKYVTDILERRGFKVERGVAGIPTAGVEKGLDLSFFEKVIDRLTGAL